MPRKKYIKTGRPMGRPAFQPISFDKKAWLKEMDQKLSGADGAEKFLTTIRRDFSEAGEHYKDAYEQYEGTADQMAWVRRNRVLKGRQFSYEDPGGVMMLGTRNRAITEASRPYLRQIIQDQCRELTVIKGRQCLTENNYVFTGTRFLSMKEVVEKGYRGPIYTAEKGGLIIDRVVDAWKGEKKPCVRIRTRGGFFVECSTDHKVMTLHGWMKAKDLRVYGGTNCIEGAIVSVTPQTSFGLIQSNATRLPGLIKSIEDIGVQQTYDLAVSSSRRHSFLANGIVVSNSELSETFINRDLWVCCTRNHTNVRHIFPTTGVAQRFAREKVTPAVDESPRILRMVKQPPNTMSKAFTNGSFLTIDASYTDYQGRGPSSDMLVFDEYETQNPKIEEVFAESTSHSRLGVRIRISTPLAPNGGIDEKWRAGCMYRWWVKCPKCGKRQVLQFPNNIINGFERGSQDINSEEYMLRLRKVYIGCSKCKAPIDRSSQQYLDTAKWIPEKPSLVGQHNSYHLSYFQLLWKTGMEVLYKYHSFRYLYQFRNEVLGIPDLGEHTNVDEGIIRSCVDPGFLRKLQALDMYRNVSVGVDWGYVSWVVVRACGLPGNPDKSYIIFMERIDDECLRRNGISVMDPMAHAKRVEQVASAFKATILINDANGIGKDRDTYLYRKFPGRSWGCFYDTGEIQKQKRHLRTLEPQWQTVRHRVVVARTSSLKLMLQEYRDHEIGLPREDADVAEFVKQVSNLLVVRMEDPRTMEEYEVVGKKGPDHYGHASNYAKIGFDHISGRESGAVTPGVIEPARPGIILPDGPSSIPPEGLPIGSIPVIDTELISGMPGYDDYMGWE